MGFLSYLFGNKPEKLETDSEDGAWGNLWSILGGRSNAGVRVDEHSAMTYSAVFCASRILAEGVSSIPLRLVSHNQRAVEVDHPLNDILCHTPNHRMDAMTFWEMITNWLVNAGNGFAEIERNNRGEVIALWPIFPYRVQPFRLQNDLFFRIVNLDGTMVVLPENDVLNIVGCLSDDGVLGKGVWRQAAESIGGGIAAERYGASFFANSGVPSGIITTKIPGRGEVAQKQLQEMKEKWKSEYTGPGASSRTAFMTGDLQYLKIGIAPEEAQFLQSRGYSVQEVSRFYRVPLHKMNVHERTAAGNMEIENQSFINESLRPWCCRIEQAVARQLLTPEERKNLRPCFDYRELLRADSKTRNEVARDQFINGLIDLDEWRTGENLPPVGGELGSTRFLPMNITTATAILAGENLKGTPSPPKIGQKPGDGTPDLAAKVLDKTLLDCAKRILNKEILAAERAAKSISGLRKHIDKFYLDFSNYALNVFDPAIESAELIGTTHDFIGIVDQWIEDHKSDLEKAIDGPEGDLIQRVKTLTSEWEKDISCLTN